jgi:hypothetical protein
LDGVIQVGATVLCGWEGMDGGREGGKEGEVVEGLD